MNAREVMMNMKQGESVHMVLNLLAERIRQASETAHLHSHVEILSLNVAGRNVFLIGGADNLDALGALTLRRAVALLCLRIVAVHLHKLREVDVRFERIRHGVQIHLMAVRGQLDAIRQTRRNVLDKRAATS